MKARPAFWLVLSTAGVLWLLSRTRKGQAVVAEATDAIASGVIGFRLNNPLNVERGQDWQGLAPDQPHARFAKFLTMAYGIRAWHKIMQTYVKSYGVRSVDAIIDRYNPQADGQPQTYKPAVRAALGVTGSQRIDVMQPATARALCRAMMRIEIGSVAAALVTDATVDEGLRMAGVAA
jgi:hypothetical protein